MLCPQFHFRTGSMQFSLYIFFREEGVTKNSQSSAVIFYTSYSSLEV